MYCIKKGRRAVEHLRLETRRPPGQEQDTYTSNNSDDLSTRFALHQRLQHEAMTYRRASGNKDPFLKTLSFRCNQTPRNQINHRVEHFAACFRDRHMHSRPPRDEVIYNHQRMLMPVELSQELEPNFLVVHALDKEMIKCFFILGIKGAWSIVTESMTLKTL
jgi:hypothetical protein